MKRFLRIVSLLLVALILVLIVNTIRFSSKQMQVEPISLKAVNDAPIQRLTEAVQVPTVSAKLPADSSAFRAFDEWLDQAFPGVDSLLDQKRLGTFSRLYTWPGKNANLKPVMLIAHTDVVDIATPDAWAHEPFSGAIADGFVWGRGTLDDKVSVMGILEAVELLLQEGYSPERTIYFGFGHDEEVGGSGAQAIAKHLKEEGITLEYVLDEGYYVIEEALPGLVKPLAMVGISEKGYVTLKLEAEVEEAGHSSMPPQITAIGVLSDALQKLEQNPFPAKIEGPLREMFEYAGPEMSPAFRMVFANLWLTGGLIKKQLSAGAASNALLRTTTAPTIVNAGLQENVLPTRAEAVVNFRIIPGETAETVLVRVKDLVENDHLTVAMKTDGIYKDPSPVASTEAFGYQVISKTIRELFPDAVVAPNVTIGATDVSYYSEVSDQLYRFLPFQLQQEDLSRIHGSNERVGIDQYKRAIRWYEQLIRNSCR